MAEWDPNERRYEGYRQAAREATMDAMYERAEAGEADRDILFGLELTAIDDVALAAWETQWTQKAFPWRRIVGQTKAYIRRFETAIWVSGLLLGLAIGRASRGNDNVTLHYIERDRGRLMLKGYVAEIAIEAADSYAAVIGRQRVKLKNPVQGAIPVYQALGFELAETYRGSAYYDRSVEP